MSLKSLQVFVTTDGKQFEDEAAALSHQTALDNAEVVEAVASSFVNVTSAPGSKEVGLVGRTRAFNSNVAAATVSFMIAQGLVNEEALEQFAAIKPSEALQARLDAEAAKEAEKAAKKNEKTEAKTEEPVAEDAEASADLFA
jgi:hypothetical protein